MGRYDCSHEADVLTMVYTGRWPERTPDELRAHVSSCAICADVVRVASAIESETESPAMDRPLHALPGSGTVWWRAQIRARQDAAKQVVRPITAAQALGLAALFGAAGAVFGATAPWFQSSLRWFGRALSAASDSLHLPALPELPTSVSGVWIGYWVILLVVAASLVTAAAVMGWAMKEDKT